MNETEFNEAILMLRSDDSLIYEEGYQLLVDNIDKHFDSLTSLINVETDPAMKGRFLELMGHSHDARVIDLLAGELKSSYREVRMWAFNMLNLLELPEGKTVARRFQEQNPEEDFY